MSEKLGTESLKDFESFFYQYYFEMHSSTPLEIVFFNLTFFNSEKCFDEQISLIMFQKDVRKINFKCKRHKLNDRPYRSISLNNFRLKCLL